MTAKNKTVRGTWVEALEMDGLGDPKRIIYSMLGHAVTNTIRLTTNLDVKAFFNFKFDKFRHLDPYHV